ncbi:MAG TPA: VWA domain-containing protein, partial [Edaphobacter sp.]
VTAFDKKNRPISDLTLADFEIYDNGRKQTIRFFNQPSVATMEAPRKTPTQFAYSNRRAISANAGPETTDRIGHVTVFLIDASNLSWADLTYVRGQILKFMRGLPAQEHVALYALQSHGFQVLEEETTDHESLEAKLKEWMPSSQELTRTQAEDRRNQQQTDTVSNPSDRQTVTGTSSQAPNTGTLVDPALRQISHSPESDTLSIMVEVARHLAAIPGHKNLVWVTSDSVLGGLHVKSASVDKGNKRGDELAMHAQEAMNDARVSVYPLDASQPAGDVSIAAHPDADLAQTTNLPTSANIQRGPNTVEMQQSDLHPIQGPMRTVADATGGHAIRRAGDIATALNRVVEDDHATYLISFRPDVPPDGQYHTLDVKLTTQHGITLSHRTGYQYAREPATLKDRFGQAIWQTFDMNEIGVSANLAAAPVGAVLKLNIAASDLAFVQQEDRWVDNLDTFLVQRDDGGLHAEITGQTLVLVLKSATYQTLSKEGIPFDQPIEKKQNVGSVRVVVVDENSGKMGSVTIPAAALQSNP